MLLTYKNQAFQTVWHVNDYERIPFYKAVADLDHDGDKEFAVAVKEYCNESNLYVVELTEDKLWRYQELLSDNEEITKYVEKNIKFVIKEDEKEAILNTKHTTSKFTYSQEPPRIDQPWIDQSAEFFVADKPIDVLANEDFCQTREASVTEYFLKEGEMACKVFVDVYAGEHYGYALFKVEYSEKKGFSFKDFEFVKLQDMIY